MIGDLDRPVGRVRLARPDLTVLGCTANYLDFTAAKMDSRPSQGAYLGRSQTAEGVQREQHMPNARRRCDYFEQVRAVGDLFTNANRNLFTVFRVETHVMGGV